QALTLLAASVAHEIGNPLNALHIHMQLMEREIKKLRPGVESRVASVGSRTAGRTNSNGRPRARPPASEARAGAEAAPEEGETAEIARRLEQYLGVAKGEINRLDYIITQFLHAIRPTPPQLKPGSLNDVVHKTLALLQPELDNRGLNV